MGDMGGMGGMGGITARAGGMVVMSDMGSCMGWASSVVARLGRHGLCMGVHGRHDRHGRHERPFIWRAACHACGGGIGGGRWALRRRQPHGLLRRRMGCGRCCFGTATAAAWAARRLLHEARVHHFSAALVLVFSSP
jgi:hypothetical protein